MADKIDVSSPFAVIGIFLASMVTALMVVIKMGMALGVIGALAGLGLFFKMMWFDK